MNRPLSTLTLIAVISAPALASADDHLITVFEESSWTGCEHHQSSLPWDLSSATYNSYLTCDAQDSWCGWNFPTEIVAADAYECQGGDATQWTTVGHPFRSVDLHGGNTVCICPDDGSGLPNIDHACIQLASQWVDLGGWPADFSYFMNGGCGSEALVAPATSMITSGTTVVTNGAGSFLVDGAKTSATSVLLASNEFAQLQFTATGDLVLFTDKHGTRTQVWDAGTGSGGSTPVAGYKFQFANGKISVTDPSGVAQLAFGGGVNGTTIKSFGLDSACTLSGMVKQEIGPGIYATEPYTMTDSFCASSL